MTRVEKLNLIPLRAGSYPGTTVSSESEANELDC